MYLKIFTAYLSIELINNIYCKQKLTNFRFHKYTKLQRESLSLFFKISTRKQVKDSNF